MTLAERLPADLQPLAARWRQLPHSDAPSLSRWLEPELLGAALARYARTWPQADPRAVASHWHQASCALLLPPLLLGGLLEPEPPSLDPARLRMTVDAQGAPAELHLPLPPGAVPGERNGARLLDLLQEQLLHPLVSRFAAHTGLAPRLLWGNVALCIDWVLDMAQGWLPDRALGEARAHFRDTRRQDACGALRAALRRDAAGVTRRVCCLRERLPLQRCVVCPLARRQNLINTPT
ncbi:siderophore-iron reductase FhuF [Pseudomonas shirazensis]|uniref:siderophore-iron reductase FhuF n=1 Tax=Pseudomonas shirazensis TaxID=2745494 RepID=UPI003D2CF0D0